MKAIAKFAGVACALLVLCAAMIWFLNTRDEAGVESATASAAPDASQVQRGAYLARAGNCMTCHTAVGGARYAGGRGVDTPFGTVFTSNLTPDMQTGIGSWSTDHFWRALHNGRSRDGRLLYPAFPYTNYTQVTRKDSDALLAFLKSLPPVPQANRDNTLRFPYNTQAALAVWRAMYFSPGTYKPDAGRNADWNRGAYLVNGLGHCSACHTARNAMGALGGIDLGGGLIPVQNWYAPSLVSGREAGLAEWDVAHIVSLFKNGMAPGASVSGPMLEVVQGGTQYLTDQDLTAMAQFLKALPQDQTSGRDHAEMSVMGTSPVIRATGAGDTISTKGAKIYEQSCAQCHGDKGQGVANAYPALAGNRAVLMPQAVNLVQIVLNGGFAAATQGNPRPYGMPPFVLVLDDSDVSAVLTYIRGAWGNQASAVSTLEVNRNRAGSGRQ